eukprot:CAMPEP_0196138784 /NCGR_PEP_ID=MMETSP0910-20130528/6299_1 /TAXON_ID=49265 /ORGANISM="Thalassiosira rotula, Strain GSO102" /LENGTH=75 /DNA_ID=CAMNT_0041399431 /DNA_START=216 /DNA_END=443 /DNA_ORIENTATION=-
MPPRLPHRLTKPVTDMNKSELAVLAALGVSVSVGLMQMGLTMVKFYSGGNNKESDASRSAACPMNWGKTENDAPR